MAQGGAAPTRVKDGASCRLCGGLLPHGLDDGLHLLPLPLGEVVRPDPLLQELQATLLLANPADIFILFHNLFLVTCIDKKI